MRQKSSNDAIARPSAWTWPLHGPVMICKYEAHTTKSLLFCSCVISRLNLGDVIYSAALRKVRCGILELGCFLIY